MIWGSYASTNKLFVQFIHKPKRLLACMDYIKTTSPQSFLVSPHLPLCVPHWLALHFSSWHGIYFFVGVGLGFGFCLFNYYFW